MTTYKDSGVDVDASNRFVELIKPLVKSTARAGTTANIGGFGAVFDMFKTGFQDPLLVSATDGVGTKLEIAIEVGKHDTIGIDLVAMCVNDIVVQGAEPLFFLDYFATGKLDQEIASEIINGIVKGCKEAGCALIGGETAEMPGIYKNENYDLVGFAVGAVEHDSLLTGQTIIVGDVVLGLASNGLHSNGFSLVRQIVNDLCMNYSDFAVFANSNLGDALLIPTRIYVKSCLKIVSKIKGLAHITGGGLIGNIPRILPNGVAIKMDQITWPVPPVFTWLAIEGDIKVDEMIRTFNCGIGMAVVVSKENETEVMKSFIADGEQPYRIGTIVEEFEETWPNEI